MAPQIGFSSFFISPFGDDDEQLNKFLRSRRIINVDKHAIDSQRGVGWMILIEYLQDGQGPTKSISSRIDYREVFSGDEFQLFDKLRKLRKDLAEKQGIPVYAIFSNEQLASMVRERPLDITNFKKIAGIGDSKANQYGTAFLEVINGEQVKPAQAEKNATDR